MQRLLAGTLAAARLTGGEVAPVARDDYSPIDRHGVDMAQRQQAYVGCSALANQTRPEDGAAAGAIAGAARDAAFSALLGAAIYGRDCAGYGADVGAASGVALRAAYGVVSGTLGQQPALRQRLIG